MAHKHSVYDTDPHFAIDPITRAIINQSTTKTQLMQYDHNSERFTFEIPRLVDGHDMQLCDKIEIHYINVDAATKQSNADVYKPDDMQLSPESDDVVIFSWLISGNATQYAGTLNFIIRFLCHTGTTIDYAWGTDMHKGISVGGSYSNGEMVVAEYSDVLEAWKAEIIAGLEGGAGVIDNSHLSVLQNKVICIGDSLTAGAYYSTEMGDSGIAESYPYFLSKLTRWKVTNAGRSGERSSTFYNYRFGEYDFAKYDTAIIWLGTNGGLTDTLANDTASGAPSTYAETETGYYCRIIEGIVAQNTDIRIILGTIYSDFQGTHEIANKVIRQIAEKYSANVVGVVENNIPELNDLTNTTVHVNGVHFSKVGNAILAKHWLKGITNIMSENPLAFNGLTPYTSNFNFEDYNLPVIYFEGDTLSMTKDNAVTLNYRYGERSGTCTLKWQGSSALLFPKKNYTVKFDNAFEAVAGWGAQKKYCLKADWVDFSHCRNVVSAKLWGDIVRSRATSDLVTRLSTLPNCGAVDGFPCFVVINGEWQGIFNFNIPKDDWMMGMGSGTKEAILCCEGVGDSINNACAFKAEATLGVEFELEYGSEGWAESDIQASLNTLIRAVMNSDGTDIDTTIAQYLDIDSAIDYALYSQLIGHHDGICKNYILATYDGVKWFFSAYDMDNVFGQHYPGDNFDSASVNVLEYTSNRLFNLFYYHKFEDLRNRFEELLTQRHAVGGGTSIDGVMSLAKIAEKFTDYGVKIPLPAYVADAEKWTSIPSTSVNNVGQAISWYAQRADVLVKEYQASGTTGLIYRWGACKGIGSACDIYITLGTYGYTEDGYVDRISNVGTEAFRNNTLIENVIIPRGYKSLSNYAFGYCTSLRRVDIPDTVTAINAAAFRGCTALKTIALPKLITVGTHMFADCTSLIRIRLSGVPELSICMFANCTALTDIFYDGTMAEWEALTKGADWNANTGAYTVHCSDGDVAKA